MAQTYYVKDYVMHTKLYADWPVCATYCRPLVRAQLQDVPMHRGAAADHLIGLEETLQDARGAVLHDHLRGRGYVHG